MNLPVIPSWASVALKFAPYVAIAVLFGLLLMSNNKVANFEAQVAAKTQQVTTLTTQRDFFATAVSQRDLMIAAQNASIDTMVANAAKSRALYEADLRIARGVSANNMKAAGELLALKAPEGELMQCRAARDLLETELVL